MKDAIGPGEAARRLGVSTRTVQRWLREGRLPQVRVGSHVKVVASAVPSEVGESAGPQAARRIGRLLVANRGELVVRIARTCRQMGVNCLGLVADDQAQAWWTTAVDELVPLAGSYLDGPAVIAAARAANADAIHPGYGFLAENADFAEQVTAAGLIWVGPPPEAMRALGDKAAARRLATKLGVPTLTGYDGDDQSDAKLAREAKRIGFPILVKPTAGGGGKGMHMVSGPREMTETLARARREAKASFGDDRLILERYLERPRHVEVQLLGDTHGNAVHLGERECSLQRRHQKVIEESPSPAVNAKLRKKLGDAALMLALEAGYTGAGTAEFLLAPDGEFYFLELNARLQVEHPVTELVTGRDLVRDQLQIAEGRPLGFSQADISLTGHAVEARLYAEDPLHDFLPATGGVLSVTWPRDGVRVDAGIGQGDIVGTRYDPLLAKLIVHSDTRRGAFARLADALDETTVLGVTTNRGFLKWLATHPDVVRGQTFTPLIDEEWQPPDELPASAWSDAAAELAHWFKEQSVPIGFRLNARPRLRVQIGNEVRSVEIPVTGSKVSSTISGAGSVMLDLDGQAVSAVLAPAPTVEAALREASHAGSASQSVAAPMPGNVLAVRVAEGDAVEAGQVLVVLEAMKMENNVPAPAAGRVARVLVTAGQQVQRAQTLVELA
ncbi:MAG TPA: biotin carboxylase N-terminal domain-containing protein [Candidatus Limnocylindria bacterium]|nr:biotin carboxylase N-terminal domain-containing protein [Candidatus Limnocylindria bacterium]